MCVVLIIYNFACPVTFTSTGRSGFQALTIVVVAAAAKLELVGFHYCEMVASCKRRRRRRRQGRSRRGPCRRRSTATPPPTTRSWTPCWTWRWCRSWGYFTGQRDLNARCSLDSIKFPFYFVFVISFSIFSIGISM